MALAATLQDRGELASLPPAPVRDRAERGQALARLRASIGAIERGQGRHAALPLAPGLDPGLPWGGLPRGALHEMTGGQAAFGFLAAVLSAVVADGGQVLWCQTAHAANEAGELYGAGLAHWGIAPDRLVIARARNTQDMLWAMEEGLRSAAVAAVVGEAARVSLTANRRLQLAAETTGALAFLLDRLPRVGVTTASAATTAALTRWRVSPARTGSDHAPRWQVDLDYCRGGPSRAWQLEWRPGASMTHDPHDPAYRRDPGGLAVVAELRDRPAGGRAVA
ncbi:MAG: hypothetical protein FJX65_05525 [Alphaproteobacteria bacterium]|nr:hypothetical protein [Alphaproteobacteria bacterium]